MLESQNHWSSRTTQSFAAVTIMVRGEGPRQAAEVDSISVPPYGKPSLDWVGIILLEMFRSATEEDLVHDLYTWGPALVQDIRSRFPYPTIKTLVQNKMVVQKRFTGFEVYVLSGVGLRPYRYAVRYNHVPAKTVVLGALVIRAMARQYAAQGHAVELYNRYSSRKRDNLLLLRRGGRLTLLIGRSSITMKSVGEIVSNLTETLEVDEVVAVVLGTDQSPRLLNATRVADLPFAVINLPVTRITRETFTSERPASA